MLIGLGIENRRKRRQYVLVVLSLDRLTRKISLVESEPHQLELHRKCKV